MLLPATWWLHHESRPFTDDYLYDWLLSWHAEPASPDILLVNIDERSLARLGRWPWSRSTHARLLDRLRAGGARAVAFDVLFLEPSQDPEEDRAFAAAIERHGGVFLPLTTHSSIAGVPGGVTLPIEPLRLAATGLGHIDVQVDRDGVVRNIELEKQLESVRLPQLMLRLHEWLEAQGVVSSEATANASTPPWRERDSSRVRIPYRGHAGHYASVPYASVLAGEVPASLLEGRIVLVGMTALGMGDRYAVSLLGQGVMPGVEIQAQLLDALRDRTFILEVDRKLGAWMACLPALALLLALLIGRFRYLARWGAAIGFATLLGVGGAMTLGWWWPPTVSLLGLVVVVVLFSWRSQAEALSWFQHELKSLSYSPDVLPDHYDIERDQWGGRLQQKLLALDHALQRLKDARCFITDAMNSLPVAVFITSETGDVLLSNRLAQELRATEFSRPLANIETLLAAMLNRAEGTTTRPGGWNEHLGDLHGQICIDSRQHCFRIEVSALRTSAGQVGGVWLLGFVDLTVEVRAEEQRSQMLRFLSHDLKSPQTSALALIDLQRNPRTSLPPTLFHERLEQRIRTALLLTDDFIQITRLESFQFEFRFVLLEDVLLEVLDQALPLARTRGIHLESHMKDDSGGPVMGERSYLSRAIYNLVENAIKYSEQGDRVDVSIYQCEQSVMLEVSDEGLGIEREALPYIFESYRRSHTDEVASGYGLGLALVKTVLERHGGGVNCESQQGKGSRFWITLPRCEDIDVEDEEDMVTGAERDRID
ncbi:two-component sensor [Halomonas urumqiensis]|nr:two-component sensor [Halomonas urumqiensis]